MSYSIVFTGQIRPEFEKEAVVKSLAIMFRKDAVFIEKMFTGKPVVIKRDLGQEEARKYQFALNKAGVFANLVEQEAAGPIGQGSSMSDTNAVTVAHQGKIQGGHEKVSPVAGTNEITIAEPGAKIIDYVIPDEPAIDISQLSMSAAGGIIVESSSAEEAVIISELAAELSDIGSTLSDETPPRELEIDISAMSMAEAGSDIQDR